MAAHQPHSTRAGLHERRLFNIFDLMTGSLYEKPFRPQANCASKPELQIKKNSCQTLGPASERVLPDLLFFLEFFLIFHFQYSMIKAVHRFTQKHPKTHKTPPQNTS